MNHGNVHFWPILSAKSLRNAHVLPCTLRFLIDFALNLGSKLDVFLQLWFSLRIANLRACLKSLSLSQKALIFEHRSAVYMGVNEQRSTKNRWFMAKIRDFKQPLTGESHHVS